MRILCLNIEKTSDLALTDIFLKFSPRLQFRRPGWLFIDITPTAHLFESESALLEESLQVCELLKLPARGAVSDTPYGAQLFTQYNERFISLPGNESEDLAPLPVRSLVWFEGVKAWSKPPQVLQVASFFQSIGIHTLGQIRHFGRSSFQERWGELGVQIWRRLQGTENQVISPWLSAEPLHFYQHLDEPLVLLSHLLHTLQRPLNYLFARLQGRSLFAQKLILTLHCEYSQARHNVTITPAIPNRDQALFETLIEQKLDGLDLENPIREFEIDVVGCEETQRQLDFWEPRTSDQDKVQRLLSLLQQANCQAGFYHLRNSILPEQTWECATGPRDFTPLEHEVEFEQNAYQVRVAYGQAVLRAPRPTRLLKKPKLLRKSEIQRLHLLSGQPVERLEEGWWGSSHQARDYYFAVSKEGQCLWVYKERQNYFLHGYFD